MLSWVDEHGLFEAVVPAIDTSSSGAPWITENGRITYRHLLPGTEIIASGHLPRREWFDFDYGRMDIDALLFTKPEALADCLITARVFVDRLLVGRYMLDPVNWKPDIVTRIFLGSQYITHDQIIIVRLERPVCDNQDTVCLIGFSFKAKGIT